MFAVCALCSGSYHLGVGALVNSLYRNGFRGTVWVGYQGRLPRWAAPVTTDGEITQYAFRDDCAIRFVELDTSHHISQAKPVFMSKVLGEFSPDAEGVFYFDADSVIKCDWSFFENWVRCGVGLCMDGCYTIVPERHPWRVAWRRIADACGPGRRETDYYFASGFVAVPRSSASFLEVWAEAIRAVHREADEAARSLKLRERTSPFACPDQDALNIAVMATDCPISPMGPEAMDFVPAGYVMSQVISEQKPWNKNFLAWAVRGTPPATADKMYWHYADGPIRMYSPLKVAWKRAEVRLAALIGRFYRRT